MRSGLSTQAPPVCSAPREGKRTKQTPRISVRRGTSHEQAPSQRLDEDAVAFFAKLNPKNKLVLTYERECAEMHCQKGAALLLDQIEFDWLSEAFEC